MIVGLLSVCLLGCVGESERNRKLLQEIDREKQKQVFLQKNLQELSKEVQTVWMRSLKYRFPQVQKIIAQQIPMQLKQLHYIKHIRFTYGNRHNIFVYLTYKTMLKGISPDFVLYLFNSDGRNIHRQRIVYTRLFGWKKKYLEPGVSVSKKYEVKILSRRMPRFFLLGEKK